MKMILAMQGRIVRKIWDRMLPGCRWCALVSAMCIFSLEGAGAPLGAKLLSLRLIPESATLWGAGASQRFLVLGRYSDGLERDVTGRSRFAISKTSIARVDQLGRVVGLSDGQLVLRARLGAKRAKAKIRVTGAAIERPLSFARDIGGIFTKRGCSDSSCHGGVKGKGGFKLSLNAVYPRDDYKWIVEGGTYQVLTTEAGEKIPRISLKAPKKSLLLTKATMSVPHVGGQPLRPNSADYETILNWVRSGAPNGEEGGGESVQVVRVEVEPRELVLTPEGKHRLLVTAHLSNGRQEDITDQVRYVSNNSEVVKVDEQGQVAAVRAGETSVMVRASGYAVSARVGVVAEPIPRYPRVPRNNFIDQYVFAKLKKFHILPSELSTDAEFLRRVCLDVTGTLPPSERARDFLASKDPKKRDKLIEALLNTPQYVDYWTFRFADLFRVAFYPASLNAKLTQNYWVWIQNNIRDNKPYDQVARERIAGQGNSGPVWHYVEAGNLSLDPLEPKMAEQVRVFLGRRLDCAQCHNHPFEAWSQDQFWGLAAFFGRMNVMDTNLNAGTLVIYDDPEGKEIYDPAGQADKTRKLLHPRTKEEAIPTFLDGMVLPENQRMDLRLRLAEWMTSHPYFAEAAVNRMWSYFFGQGIVNPVDDFRSANPPTHPELLQALAKEFRDHGHDLKHLIRVIVSSRAYQLSSRPSETNAGDRINYSYAIPRHLDAEVLLDAISHVTGVAQVFAHARSAERLGTLPPGTRAINVIEPDLYECDFCDMYGRSGRTSVPERKVKANLKQALHMLVGSTYREKISAHEGRLHLLLNSGASDREIITELVLAALSRFPTEEEMTTLEELIGQWPSRKQALENVLWAVVTSREFAENH